MQPFVCAVCCYPANNETQCSNPGCIGNPSVTQKQKDAWKTEIDKRNAEEAERERIRGIRRRMMK